MEEIKSEKKQKFNINRLNMILVIALAVIVLYNQYQISSANGGGLVTAYSDDSVTLEANVIPTGVPESYGQELGISFDDVSPSDPVLADQTIETLSEYDRTMTLTGEDLERYIRVAGSISCEYCCGANAIIFSNGEPACGCAHSYAMRGLAKYLIQNHGDEFTDEQILEELGKWKTLFFPGQLTAKARILQENGIDVNYISLASNQYRGIEKGTAGGGMVGGC